MTTKKMSDFRIDWSKCPEAFRCSLENYVLHGLFPGQFLFCVLTNDLMGAMRYWDSEGPLQDLTTFVYCSLPGLCYGTSDDVFNWQAQQAA